MAKNSIRDYDASNSNNTDIQSIDISEGCSPAGINNAIREVMADLKDVSVGTVALESPKFDSILDGNIKATDASGTDAAGTATTIKGGAGTGTGAGYRGRGMVCLCEIGLSVSHSAIATSSVLSWLKVLDELDPPLCMTFTEVFGTINGPEWSKLGVSTFIFSFVRVEVVTASGIVGL